MHEVATRRSEPGFVGAQPILAAALVTLSLLAGCGAAPGTPADRTGAASVAASSDMRGEAQGDARKPRLKLTAERSDPFLDELQARTFQYFWKLANPANGLVPDRWPDGNLPNFCSIAAVGFALTAYPIGVERGFVSREDARDRVLTTLRFFAKEASQGPEPTGRAGYKGFFYHFLNTNTGVRYAQDVELSSIDTTLLLAGALACQSYFDRDDPGEAEIRTLADELYRAADWSFFQPRPPLVSMGWAPPDHFNTLDWRGYDEAMILYVLALGSPTHTVAPEAWPQYTSTYTWCAFYGQENVTFGPLFGHQFSHIWLDLRGLQDDYMRGRGIDYFENTRRAVYAQRAYAIANPGGWTGYGENIWGFTACDGPADGTFWINGQQRAFITYGARAAGCRELRDDGTVAPYAAVASVTFAPEVAIPAVKEIVRRFGDNLYSTYGFLDSFNPTFTLAGSERMGRVVPGAGWFDTDYLGIDQGPIVAMIENYRNGFIWALMRKNPYIVNGLRRAGFSGGWLASAPE